MYVLHRKGLLLPLKIKAFMMKKFFYTLVCVLLFASCTSGKPKEEAAGKSDSLASALDTCTADSVPNPPKAADGLFDDFIYSFMSTKRFQYERIIFPLKNVVALQNGCTMQKLDSRFVFAAQLVMDSL